jgi:hypothetical protein
VDLELGQLTGGEHGAERERQRDEKQPVGPHTHKKKINLVKVDRQIIAPGS